MSKSIPKASGAKPEVGHMEEYQANQPAFLKRIRAECGDLAEYNLMGQPHVLMSGPDAQEAWCRAPDEVLGQSAAYKGVVPIFGKGVLFDTSLERLKQQLKIQVDALRYQNMKAYAQVIADEVRDFTNNWGESGELEMVDEFLRMTLYTSTSCLLGVDFRRNMTDEFSELYRDLEHAVIAIAFIDPYLPLPEFEARDKARARLGEIVEDIVAKRRASREEYSDALNTFMTASYTDGTHMSPHEITGLLIATMFAGHHTSSGTATWMLIEFLRNPQFMEEVKQELAEVFADGGEVSHHAMRGMPKMEAFIREVLRVHPPLSTLIRVVEQDFDYKGTVIPKGYRVVMSPGVAHKIAEVFPDPEKFDMHRPEPEHLFAWVAFGGGRHKCAGNAFAILQLKAIFATLLLDFDFSLADAADEYMDDHSGMTVKPKAPMTVRFTRKKK
ncbi:MAG TPA: cytochrome P450 [Pseudomonadales bacterium]|nr:cytochrome P450 [Pseudomonadales bacterium]